MELNDNLSRRRFLALATAAAASAAAGLRASPPRGLLRQLLHKGRIDYAGTAATGDLVVAYDMPVRVRSSTRAETLAHRRWSVKRSILNQCARRMRAPSAWAPRSAAPASSASRAWAGGPPAPILTGRGRVVSSGLL